MRTLLWLCLALAMTLWTGCVPARVLWSPDGTQATILGDDGLHLCDLAGKLSPMLVPDVKSVAWMPNSKQIVVQKTVTVTTWTEFATALPTEAKEIERNTDQIAKVRATLIAAAAKPSETADAFQKDIGDTDINDAETVERTIIYLRDHEQATLQPKLGSHWDYLTKLAMVKNVVQLYDLSGSGAKEGPVLYVSVQHAEEDLSQLRISPTGKAVVVVRTHQENAWLVVVSTDGEKRVCTLGAAAMYPDWTPDGKYLVYIKPAHADDKKARIGNQDFQLGTLVRQQMADASGALIPQDKLPGSDDLAGLLFDSGFRVRIARDGRIFFLTAEVTLPVADDGAPDLTLFSMDTEKQFGLTRVVPRSATAELGDAPQLFEVSPSGKYISIPFKDGRVSVLDVAKGQVECVQTEAGIRSNDDWKLVTLPVWRSDDELTFARPQGKTTANEVVRYSISEKKAITLSNTWGKAIGEWIAGKDEPTTATAPATPK